MKKVVELTETLIISFFVMLLVSVYFFRVFTVNGDSMRDTLSSGDRIIAELVSSTHKQGDIVVIHAAKSVTLNDDGSLNVQQGLGGNIVKRIIATGGQTINIDFGSGAVYIDGERIFEDYLKLGLTHRDEGAFEYPVTVPQGYVFVMGDYRSSSEDSRSSKIGFVPESDIIGRVVFRILPINKAGGV